MPRSRTAFLSKLAALFALGGIGTAVHTARIGFGTSGAYHSRDQFYGVSAPRCHTQKKRPKAFTKQAHRSRAFTR